MRILHKEQLQQVVIAWQGKFYCFVEVHSTQQGLLVSAMLNSLLTARASPTDKIAYKSNSVSAQRKIFLDEIPLSLVFEFLRSKLLACPINTGSISQSAEFPLGTLLNCCLADSQCSSYPSTCSCYLCSLWATNCSISLVDSSIHHLIWIQCFHHAQVDHWQR